MTRTVWTLADTAGSLVTTAWFNGSTWQRFHRPFDAYGDVTKSGAGSEAALQAVPVARSSPRARRQAKKADR